MACRRIGQEGFGFVSERSIRRSFLDDLTTLVDRAPVEHHLAVIPCAAKGEPPAWPPLALFKAMLIAVWYDLSDVKLAEALDDRASFRWFCGFSASEPTPERTAFVRFRKTLIAHELDRSLFEEITGQLKGKAVRVKTGTLVDATINHICQNAMVRTGQSRRSGSPHCHCLQPQAWSDNRRGGRMNSEDTAQPRLSTWQLSANPQVPPKLKLAENQYHKATSAQVSQSTNSGRRASVAGARRARISVR